MKAREILTVADTFQAKVDFGRVMLQRIYELEARAGKPVGLSERILLAETGTVEQILSILTNSQVRVKVSEQKENATTIVRKSLIMNHSGKVLIRAESKVFKRNLSANIVSRIRRKESGIGTIINTSNLETFRKIDEVGYNHANKSFFRKYKIVIKKKVAFEIREELVGIESGPGGI